MSKLTSIKPKIETLDISRGTPAVKRLRGRHLEHIRERVLFRDNYTCRICGRVTMDLEVDHIVPLHLGGAESDSNRQAICSECHKVKSEKEREERS